MSLTVIQQQLPQALLESPDLSSNTSSKSNHCKGADNNNASTDSDKVSTPSHDLITTSPHIESFIDTLAKRQTHPCTIKPLASRDVHAAREFTSKALKVTYSTAFFLQFLYAQNCYCLVAYSNITKEIAGVITGKLDTKSNDGHIYTLAVDPAYRRLGIATNLISALQLKLASRTKVLTSLWLEVLTSNAAAIDFYIYNKFFIDDSEFKKGFYNGVHDAYVMKKMLVLDS